MKNNQKSIFVITCFFSTLDLLENSKSFPKTPVIQTGLVYTNGKIDICIGKICDNKASYFVKDKSACPYTLDVNDLKAYLIVNGFQRA